jgi:uncharacterized protein (UPF0371 family)
MTKGFDNDLYLREQTRAILDRVQQVPKLYLEFGGKLLFDYHATRVLPGYEPNVKMALLQKLRDQADVVICIFAGDIERRKMRADFGITYDADALKLIDDVRDRGINVVGVVITRYNDQPAARQFRNKLERRGIRVYLHKSIAGYPADVDLIVSDRGYGANPYIETARPLVVVTGPGPGSGKLATCLTLLYHDYRQGRHSGYAKFETFPIWNLPLEHPVNVAYESATADLGDFNLVDPHHLAAYGESSVNYNRDVDAFPVLGKILDRITGGAAAYRSPTDMGVNRAGFGICDDAAVRRAACQEIVRRHFRYACEYALGLADQEAAGRAESIMQRMGLSPEDRPCVTPAREAARLAPQRGKGHDGIYCGAAIELRDGRIVTGQNSTLMHAAASVVLNAIKLMAEVPERMHLLSPSITASVSALKRDVLAGKAASLNVEEALIALSISATTNPAAQFAMEKLGELAGCEMHMTHLPTPGDEAGLKKLGINLTTDPNFPTRNLYVE